MFLSLFQKSNNADAGMLMPEMLTPEII